ERTVPRGREPIACLPRSPVPRDVRDLRLPDEAARRDAARSRCGARSPERLPVPSGRRDTVAANAAPRRERTSGRGVPRVARTVLERDLPRAARKQIQAARREVSPAGSGGGVLVRLCRWAKGRARPDPQRDALVAPRQRR